MFLFLLAIAFLFPSLDAIIVHDIKENPIRHTCQNNKECSDWLNPVYPPYTFACCTTVSCDDYYSKHYVVSSGCVPEIYCRFNITVSNETLFAATMPKSRWEEYDDNLIGNCDVTRQIVGGLPPYKAPQKEETSMITIREATPEPVVPLNCSCSGTQKCCVRVKCVDSNQKGEEFYKVETICQNICPLFSTRIYEEFDIYFPIEDWQKQAQYRQAEGAPVIQKSCRETRYFLNWLLS